MADICIIGKCLGRNVTAQSLKLWANSVWGKNGWLVQGIRFIGQGYYTFYFSCAAHAQAVLTKGPWLYKGAPFLCVPWAPDFNPLQPKGILFPVWVELPFLPSEFFAVLDSAWEALGKVVLAEPANFFNDRPHARACLLLDLNKPLPETLSFCSPDGCTVRVQQIRYFNVPSYCSYCCSSGHVIRSCPKRPVRQSSPSAAASPSQMGGLTSPPAVTPIPPSSESPVPSALSPQVPGSPKVNPPLLPTPTRGSSLPKGKKSSSAAKGKKVVPTPEPGWSLAKAKTRAPRMGRSPQANGSSKNPFEVLSTPETIDGLTSEVLALDVVTLSTVSAPSSQAPLLPSSFPAAPRRPKVSGNIGSQGSSALVPMAISLGEVPANNTRKKAKRKQLDDPSLLEGPGSGSISVLPLSDESIQPSSMAKKGNNSS